MISRRAMEDDRLSFEARGLLAYVLVKPNDWRIQISDLRRAGNMGRDKTYRVLNELISFGYVTRETERNEDGTIGDTIYLVNEKPQPPQNPTPDTPVNNEPLPENPDMVEPLPGLPYPAEPLPAEPYPVFQDHTNKEVNTDQEKSTNKEEPPPIILETRDGDGAHGGGGASHALPNSDGSAWAKPDQNSLNNGAVAVDPITLSMRNMAIEWAEYCAPAWVGIPGEVARLNDSQLWALLSWLFVWTLEKNGADPELEILDRADFADRVRLHYGNVFAGAKNRIGLIKSRVQKGVGVTLIEDDAEALDQLINGGE